MPKKTILIQPIAVERDEGGWWDHPDLPDFDEAYAAFKAWITEQRLVLQQWHMEADIDGHHPYDDGECHCSAGTRLRLGQSGSSSGFSIPKVDHV